MKKAKKHKAKLDSRILDYLRMIAQPRIGDGHRESNAYKKPGSNKK